MDACVLAAIAALPAIALAQDQDYHHNDFEWDVTMHGPVIGTAVRF
jgi:hypothetical protein